MDWKVGQAKQQFSELIHAAEREPQIILNRDRPAAAVISVENFREFQDWKRMVTEKTLAQRFAELRRIAAEEGVSLPNVPRKDRKNEFPDVLDEVPL